jgi:hypothetical protein
VRRRVRIDVLPTTPNLISGGDALLEMSFRPVDASSMRVTLGSRA